jgi:hypothetical protein
MARRTVEMDIRIVQATRAKGFTGQKPPFTLSVILSAILALLLATLSASTPMRSVKPVYFSGNGLPKLTQMTRTNSDPAHDEESGHLDIVADYFCFSDKKFFAAIQTRDGGFPAHGKLGSAWYSYMAVIADPGNDKNVWAMIYFNVPLVGFKPGLYRVEGRRQKDLVRIGNIDYRIDKESRFLVMGCNITDLLADPKFAAWYDRSDPSFAFATMAIKTTLLPYRTGTQDSTLPGALVRPKK